MGGDPVGEFINESMTRAASMPRSVASTPASSRCSSVGRHVDSRSLIAVIARSISASISCRLSDERGRTWSDGVGDDLLGRRAELPCLLAPFGVEDGGVDVRLLAGSGVEHRFAFQSPPLPRCRVAVHGGDEAIELGVDAVADVVGAARVLGEHDVGDVGHLGDAVLG